MKRNHILHTSLVLLLLAVLTGGQAMLQHRLIMKRKAEPYRFRDSLYLPASRYVQAVTIGYDHFAANFLWLRMIQSYAAGYSTEGTAELMAHYFDVITDLDPKFLPVYSFAILATTESKGQLRTGDIIQTIHKAIRKVPHDYRIPYEAAYYCNWMLKDSEKARFYARVALQDPDHPTFLDRWEGYFSLKAGRFQTAYEKYMIDLFKGLEQKDPLIFELTYGHMRRGVNSWYKSIIRDRALQWYDQHGEYPTIEQLEAGGGLEGITLPDWRMVQELADQYAQANAAPSNLDTDPQSATEFAQKTIKQWDRLPPWGPIDQFMREIGILQKYPRLKGYVIWRDMDPDHPVLGEQFVLSGYTAAQKMKEYCAQIGVRGERYFQEHGQFPSNLEAISKQMAEFKGPWGGHIVYNPELNMAYPTTLGPKILDQFFPPF